jgi:hypothetical protein
MSVETRSGGAMNTGMTDHRFVFIGGMPRSGTSAVYQLVGSHPDTSRLTNTGVPEDEGQYLQSVYPKGIELGGPARFGLDVRGRLTEKSPLVAGAGAALFRAWAPYWDLSKPVLCEKTPHNITRSRFLQAAFPDSSFIFVSRHPIAYALAIRKWENNHRIPLSVSVRNWLACYRAMREDLPHLKRALVVRYDDMAAEPVSWTRKIEDFLGIGPGMDTGVFRGGHNDRYFKSWSTRAYRNGTDEARNAVKRLLSEVEARYLERRYERAINAFGYSFNELQ